MIKYDQLRKQILQALHSRNINEAIGAVELLIKLPPEEAVEFIEAILSFPGNLGTKLEALRILPRVFTSESSPSACHLLETVLRQPAPELIRKAILAIQEVPPAQVSTSLLETILALLDHDGTDIQYQAVLTLMHLRSKISADGFISYIEPLTTHFNKVLRETVCLALCSLKQTS